MYRVAQRWRFRRRIAGILLDLCKGVSSLHWSANPLGEPSRKRAPSHLRKRPSEASVTSRVVRTILEEDGTVEQALRRLLAAFRLVSRVARAWPWGHTVTAVFPWNFAARTRNGVNPGAEPSSFDPRTTLEFLPGWERLVNVTVTRLPWP